MNYRSKTFLFSPTFRRRGRTPISDLPLGLTQPDATVRPSSDSVCRRPAAFHRAVRQATDGEPPTVVDLLSCIRDLTLKFSSFVAGLFGDNFPFLWYVVVYCLDIDHGVLSWKDCVSFGIIRLICASLGITRLIGVSLGITRLIGASFGITRLIRASFGITVKVQQGADRREARRMREGHMDASSFLYASVDVFC
ncbi:hypothetical protein E5676_scaffold1300G00090 [Cucumis melo var. makuwa]|uniref:Ty3-gypsy retrotransposon protein n=1 Tax=Cucumis melo var. makuwa TaxID=1194695 RepID=A0A5D3CBV9_CUCMM|nr:hypothetical protein E5676_scaffold1300G00090 [Cucumis melo var. makuwa]